MRLFRSPAAHASVKEIFNPSPGGYNCERQMRLDPVILMRTISTTTDPKPGDMSPRLSRGVPSAPANSPCQIDVPLVHYVSSTLLAASVTSRSPHSALKKCPKIAQFLCSVSPLEATLTDLLASVANKRLTAWLSPLDATLTKNIEGWGYPVWPPCIHFRVTQERFLRSADAF